MSFLNPAFLWAITAISIPILIHLINFRKHKLVYFSNTFLLENIRKETKSKTKLKQFLILLSRILTIIMLVFVFAGPFIPHESDRDQDIANLAVVYVDNSFSMQAESKAGILLDMAKQTALELSGMFQGDMDFLLVTNSNEPQHQNFLTKDMFFSEVSNIQSSPYQMNLDEIIIKVNTKLRSDQKANLYIISDMQESFIGSPRTDVEDNIDIIFIPLVGSIVNNIVVDTCYFNTPVHRYGQSEELMVQLTSYSNEDNYNVPVQLFLNDSLKATTGLNISANETKTVQLDYINTSVGNIEARIEITDYPIIYDNYLYFNYYISEKVNILKINGNYSSLHIKALYKSDKDNFNLRSLRLGEEQAVSLSDFDFVILNSISNISTGLAADLQNYMEEGGAVAFIPAEEINHASCNMLLSMLGGGQFDISISDSINIRDIDYENPFFEDVFQSVTERVSLPKLYMMHNYMPNHTAGASVLIDAQNNNPFLTSYSINNGSLYVFSSPMNIENIDFLRHPVFVPVFYNMAIRSQLNNRLYSLLEPNSQYEIISFGSIPDNQLLKITDNKDIEVSPNYRITGGNLNVFIPEEIDKAGNYSLIAGEQQVSTISLNYNRNQSVPNYLNSDELRELAQNNYGDKARVVSEVYHSFDQALQELSTGKMLRKYFIILALFFVICEIALIRLWKN